jgi:glycosyltransferase involved in cell wall biosynthesis
VETPINSISILIPVFNEAESLIQLHAELVEVAQGNGYDCEYVFVDDGSTDQSWDVISRLAQSNSSIRAVRFRRNFGKAAALRAAVAASTGQVLITMDADLQDDPHEIPKLLESLKPDYDLISGWKKIRQDPVSKTFPSKIFNRLVSWLTGVKLHDHNSGFKVYRREVLEEVKLYGEMHRFVPVLAVAKGFRVGEVAVNHRARKFGQSKYGWTRLIKGFLDLLTVSFLTGYHQRPQHILGLVGLLSFFLGLFGLVWMTLYWCLRMSYYPEWSPLHQRPLVLYSIGALLLGSQLLCMGFLAELIVARGQAHMNPYNIREAVNANPEKSKQDHD